LLELIIVVAFGYGKTLKEDLGVYTETPMSER